MNASLWGYTVDAQTIFEAIIAVLSLANFIVVLTVRNEILKVKLWAKDEFVSKGEFRNVQQRRHG